MNSNLDSNLKNGNIMHKIPEKMFVNVEKLGLGKSIKAGELSFEGLQLVTPKEVVVCSVKVTRTSSSTTDTTAGTEADATKA